MEGDTINKSKKVIIILLVIIIAILGINFTINKSNQKNLVYQEYTKGYEKIQNTIEQLVINLEKEASTSQLDSRNIASQMGRAESSITSYSTHLPEAIDEKTLLAKHLLDNEIQPTFSWLRDEIKIRNEKADIRLAYINSVIDSLKRLNEEMNTEDGEFDLIFTDERRQKINNILKEIVNIHEEKLNK